ncbi:MAG TPA: MBL fold metallo-hydrolase [Terriglobia bacterium]|nr:MBL fold metallo-hydrolase [Terriglobia bacterium]
MVLRFGENNDQSRRAIPHSVIICPLGAAQTAAARKGHALSVRVCVLGSGSKGNSAWVATESTCLLVDAGLSRRETCARLASMGERPETCTAILISHEHTDHVNGLKKLATELNCPVYLTRATRDALEWSSAIRRYESFCVGESFTIGDIEISPFSVPHDAADPAGFTFSAAGIKIGIVTDLGYITELVKQRVQDCHCLVFESNHDLDMLKIGPYPWHVKQRVMSRQGHLSNLATAEFLSEAFDGDAQVLVLAHLSETNNHPEIARLTALEALSRRSRAIPELHLANQGAPTKTFVW